MRVLNQHPGLGGRSSANKGGVGTARDAWANAQASRSETCDLGVHWVDLDSGGLDFTFFWPGEERWEGQDFAVKPGAVGSSSGQSG